MSTPVKGLVGCFVVLMLLAFGVPALFRAQWGKGAKGVNRDTKTAPAGSVVERDAWGRKVLGENYIQSAEWIRKSTGIREDIGNVTATAPVGQPNYLQDFFTDGRMGYMTIEVVGERGTGILRTSGQVAGGNGGRFTMGSFEWYVLKPGNSVEKVLAMIPDYKRSYLGHPDLEQCIQPGSHLDDAGSDLRKAPLPASTPMPVTPGAKTQATVKKLILCKNFESPIEATKTFKTTDTFHCQVQFNNVIWGDSIALWWLGPGGYSRGESSKVQTDQKDPVLHFFHILPSGTLKPGRYTLNVIVNGAVVKKTGFEVSDAPAQKGPVKPEKAPVKAP
ncbi:MAG: hypothetical protein RDV48_11155 [Candidatus Eremiobacteraeota bacterium]|nr:hypothetical protein [Candidatus Eremiobacteraeota bacterium]